MSSISIVLIVHVIAVFTLCSVFCIDAIALMHLRSATTVSEARPWVEPVRNIRAFAIGAVITIQISGFYLVFRTVPLHEAWPRVAMVILPAFMIPFGNMTARRMRAIRKAFRGQTSNGAQMLAMVRAPFLKISLALRISAFLGVFLLVSVKPGLWGSITLVGTCVGIGLLSALLPRERTTASSNGIA